jgi:peptide/nickel transport system permease protein
MVASTSNISRLNEEEKPRVSESLTQKAMRRLRRDKLTLFSIFVILLMASASFIGAPLYENLMGVSYERTNISNAFQSPCLPAIGIGSEGCLSKHVFGTDDLGRDHMARLLYGGQISLGIGFFGAIISLSIGLTLGMITGYYGGVIDDISNWVITTLNSIPSLFLLLIVSAVIIRNPSFSGTFLRGPAALIMILGFLGWTGTARLVRGETLSIRERDYVLSARALGASPLRVMFVHIMPNMFSILAISLALDIGGLILVEASLSYLGLGVQPPFSSWGNMLNGAQDYFRKGVHLVIFPGLFIFITVLCLYIVGDGIRDAFDPTATDN